MSETQLFIAPLQNRDNEAENGTVTGGDICRGVRGSVKKQQQFKHE